VVVGPDAPPRIAARGAGPWLASIELDIADFDPSADDISWAPAPVQAILRNARHRFFFCTHMGRSALDLRLQCFAAATLTALAGGVLFDPQAGESFIGAAALANAEREAREFEADLEPEGWQFGPFPGWENLREP